MQSSELSYAASDLEYLEYNVKDYIQERLSEVDVEEAVGGVLDEYDVDQSSISSAASSFEDLDSSTQVDV